MGRKAKSTIYTAALIGCGRVGTLLARDKLRRQPSTHAGLYHAHPRTRLLAGCDLLPERLADFGADWGISEANLFADYREMLKEVRPEIVSIATYTESHAEITCAAARAGAKIILCEKPMARTLAEARRMIRVCRENSVTLAIHHERRWSPYYRLYREMIARGDLGEIRTVIGNVLTGEPHPDWHARPDISGGGPALHDGTHLFDILRYLFGEFSLIEGECERRRGLAVEHTARAMLRFRSGAVAFVECGGRRGYFNFELDIQGSLGRLIVGNAVCKFFGNGPSPRYENFTEFAERPLPPKPDTRPYHEYIIEELIAAHESGRASISSGADGMAALKAVLDIYKGKTIIIPRKNTSKKNHRATETRKNFRKT